jgi:hypothetical protein
MIPKVKVVLDKIIEAFNTGSIPAAIAVRKFPKLDVPCNKWSFLNQLLVAINETYDARGYRQWQSANRFVKKGAKSFDILVPLTKKKEEDGKESVQVFGYKTQAVFRMEDTDGEEMPYEALVLPELPLIEKAMNWGITVEPVFGNDKYNGYFAPQINKIGLASPDECIFFHELCHYADEQVSGKLKTRQDPIQEIVAELGALSLCNIVGKDGDAYLGTGYRYIEGYAQELRQSAHSACLLVLSRVEKVLNYILAPIEPTSNIGEDNVFTATC